MKSASREDLERSIVVWIARVSEAPEPLACLDSLLEEHERERAARFRFADDRTRFVLGRNLIRHALGLYLGRKPATIELVEGNRGRPIFPEDETIHFSISHTHDVVAMALTAHAQVGVDFEFIKPSVDLPALTERILSGEDLEKFHALPDGETLPAFFHVWTRKEAYLKASGEGITEGLKKISVSFGAEAGSLTDTRDEAVAAAWHLHNLPFLENYMGALACDDAGRHVACFHVELKNRAGDTDIKLASFAF